MKRWMVLNGTEISKGNVKSENREKPRVDTKKRSFFGHAVLGNYMPGNDEISGRIIFGRYRMKFRGAGLHGYLVA